MAYDAEDVQGNFDKLMQTMDQYLNEPITDFAAIKPQLLDIFKTHRPIKLDDYKYGISKSLEENSQLIIHHFKNDRSLVREYFKSENDIWTCCECFRNASTESSEDVANALVVRGIVFVKFNHDCNPRRLSFVLKIQNFYKGRNVAKAITLQRKVLGTEDLNGVSCKQKKDVVKRKTKDCSSKTVDEMDSEVQLQYSEQKDKNVEEISPSIMDEKFDENQDILSREAAFAKIIENLKEYTNETKEVVMANKLRFISMLKAHKPVKIGDFQYGLLLNLRQNRRLIVFEWNDRRRVREYSKRNDKEDQWICRECFRLNWCKRKNAFNCALVMVNGVAFVLINHDFNCKPRDYILVMIYQKFLEEGDTTKARSMARKYGFAYGQNILPGTVNILDENPAGSLETPTSDDKKFINNHESNSKTLTNLKQKLVSDSGSNSISRNEQLPVVRKKSKRNELDLEDDLIDEENSALLDDEYLILCENDDLSIYQQSETLTEMKEGCSNTTISIYHFEKPLTSKLNEICDKLNIEYRNTADKFWDKIMFDQINTLSTRIQLHSYKRSTFYQILSIFFTGKSKKYKQIETNIVDAFREKLVSSGELSLKKFNKRYLNTVTDEHLTFIAKYLKCRILIFDGENEIKKYGKWKSTTSTRLTLVVAFVDGYYSIVLNL